MEYEKIHKLVDGGETIPDLVSMFTSKKLRRSIQSNTK